MIFRTYLRCRGCGNPFIARFAPDSTDGTNFYFPCPHCELPIRGQATGQDIHTHQMSFDCEVIPSNDAVELRVVTVNPYVPAKHDADYDEPAKTSSIFILEFLLGERLLEYFNETGRAQEAVDEGWPVAQRLYEYYIEGNWTYFDRVGSEHFEAWPSVNTHHERTTLAHQALSHFTSLIRGNLSESASRFVDHCMKKHVAACREESYLEWLYSNRDDGTFATLQRSIFDLIGLFISRFEMWKAGRLLRWVDSPTKLDDLTLFRDEFPGLRDLYQQAYEIICKTLCYPIAAQNTVKHHDPDDFGDVHPATSVVPLKFRPLNLKQFQQLSNARKVAYVALVPSWEAAAERLENDVRNPIGHATVRHDLRTGRVVSDVNKTGLSYLEFVAKVFDMFELLCVALSVVKAVSVDSSLEIRRA